MKPKLSILLTCYNKEKYIPYNLEILKTSLTDDVELHIYDDASTDNSVQVIEQVLSDYQGTNIYKHYNQINKGIGFIREQALNDANGEYFIFIDGDDLITENYVDKILSYIEDTSVIIHQFIVRLYPLGGTVLWSNPVWDKVININYVKEHNLHFNINKRSGEDLEFTDNLHKLRPKSLLHEDVLYIYNLATENSLTREGPV